MQRQVHLASSWLRSKRKMNVSWQLGLGIRRSVSFPSYHQAASISIVLQEQDGNRTKKTQEYYLHIYVSSQSDLNWENPEVCESTRLVCLELIPFTQWSSTPHEGCTSSNATPSTRVNDHYHYWDAESQLNDSDSVRSFWKKAISSRKANMFCAVSAWSRKFIW